MDDRRPCVYILASRRNGTLYVGVTSDIARRAFEHRTGAIGGFTRRYGVRTLVFLEFHETMAEADGARETHQALAAGLEAGADRGEQSAVAGHLR